MNMKKIFMMMLAFLPFVMAAQETKIAIFKYREVLLSMPEITALESEMAKLRSQFDSEMKVFQDDYERKYQDLMAKQDSLPENIYKIRVQDIQDIQYRAENFQQFAMQELEKKQTEMSAPIQEKLQKAVDQVGEENGYTLIISSEVLHFVGKSAIDATDKVKAKLGIQ